MAAYRGRVVIGRDAGNILVSPDSGESWRVATVPAGAGIVWAIAFADTATTPLRLVGVTTFGTGAATQVAAITSSDGGVVWERGSRINALEPFLRKVPDSIVFLGRPTLQFAPNASGSGRTGFLGTGDGLYSTTDGGVTWQTLDNRDFRSLEMANSRVGIANIAPFGNAAGGMSYTTDGGATWTQTHEFEDGRYRQWVKIHAFSTSVFHAFMPHRYQGFLDWQVMRTYDGGRTWDFYHGDHARRSLFGDIYWQDSTDLHMVSDGAILQHSPDGGNSFFMLRDTTPGFWQSNLDDLRLITYAPTSASDGSYLYLTIPGNLSARWRMATPQPFSAVRETAIGEISAEIRGDALLLHLDRPADLRLEVYDLMGRTVWSAPKRVYGSGLQSLPITLGSGRYFLGIEGEGRRRFVPIR
jgi:photosystem II stability/assembly factor-like uncharacterized protein